MFDALHCFLTVVDTGNLSRAAKTLQLAVSSVSRRIDWLEADVGARLFVRTSRLVLLTDAGERFVPRARHLVAELAEAKAAVTAVDPEPRGVLTVTAPRAFGRRHIAPVLGEFLHRYPLMELELQLNDDVVDLSAQRVDVAIRLGPLPDSDLLATWLAPRRRIACASPAYLARRGTPATPLELLDHNCMSYVSRSALACWWMFDGVNRNKPLPVSGALRSDDVDFMLDAAIGGAGVAHLPSWLASEALVAGQLVPLFGPASGGPSVLTDGIHAVRLPGRSHPVKAQLFIAYLRDHVGAPPYWERALALHEGVVEGG
ncbi:MAG TPA: LysR family transcriptional regulator [Telluria sp.]